VEYIGDHIGFEFIGINLDSIIASPVIISWPLHGVNPKYHSCTLEYINIFFCLYGITNINHNAQIVFWLDFILEIVTVLLV
jgi:hypothetical protein